MVNIAIIRIGDYYGNGNKTYFFKKNIEMSSYPQRLNQALTSKVGAQYYTGPYRGGQAEYDRLRSMASNAQVFGANNTANRLEARANNIRQDYNQHIANGDHIKRERSGNQNWYSRGVYWN